MDTTSVVSNVEAALTQQLMLASDNASVVAAGEALLVAFRPALERAAVELAEQAAEEVGAQLPDHEVNVVLHDGEPTLVIRSTEPQVTFSTEDLAARLTLRLPEILKTEIEEAAGTTGDSVNSYVVKALSSRGRSVRRSGKRITGKFQT